MQLNKALIASVKQDVVAFAVSEVEKFLEEHPDKIFYAFAFDCNAEYAEVNLCFNTENDFQRRLLEYQSGSWADSYQTDEEIRDLKFNTGDWEYQCFSTIYAVAEDVLNEIQNALPDDDYTAWEKLVQEIVALFSACLILFKQTETYKRIPKTADFIAFSIDHDQDVSDILVSSALS
ncbi:DUF4303 domain-containing protein [Shewanella profunda]|uniref:DUF4303 domain-containing protein n=1 Tax=Shewanella profunda TaxID=254793 RepID=UPI0020104A65|nr:DUF4303 domain-containing protein [Shewanella profunda]MCL1088573.1 DUF4303 domain-containing protein [Shewanella profunda]